MEITISLKDWADSLSDIQHKKVEFPLQIAMYEVSGDCDWSFEIKAEGKTGYVYDPWNVDVVATRCQGRSYEESKLESKSMGRIEFSFEVSSFTISDIYQEAKAAIKRASQ